MPEQQLSRDAKMAMISQFLGFMLDAYDMALVLIMAPILVKVFISPKGSAAWQYIVIVFTYSITMAARPIGSALFGRYADKIGRQFLLVFTIGGVGMMSLLGGFLPTYAQIGVWSYVAFCCLRLLMGIFFGGEYAVGHTFAIEYAPQKRRGAIGGFIQSGFPLGYVRLAGFCSGFLWDHQRNHARLWLAYRLHDRRYSGIPGALYSQPSARVAGIRKSQSGSARSRNLRS
jgi:MFS transporter, MHS family, proline/betaine transporter